MWIIHWCIHIGNCNDATSHAVYIYIFIYKNTRYRSLQFWTDCCEIYMVGAGLLMVVPFDHINRTCNTPTGGSVRRSVCLSYLYLTKNALYKICHKFITHQILPMFSCFQLGNNLWEKMFEYIEKICMHSKIRRKF